MSKCYLLRPGKASWLPVDVNNYDDIKRLIGGWMGLTLLPVYSFSGNLYYDEDGNDKGFPPTAFLKNGDLPKLLTGPILLVKPNDEDVTEELFD